MGGGRTVHTACTSDLESSLTREQILRQRLPLTSCASYSSWPRSSIRRDLDHQPTPATEAPRDTHLKVCLPVTITTDAEVSRTHIIQDHLDLNATRTRRARRPQTPIAAALFPAIPLARPTGLSRTARPPSNQNLSFLKPVEEGLTPGRGSRSPSCTIAQKRSACSNPRCAVVEKGLQTFDATSRAMISNRRKTLRRASQLSQKPCWQVGLASGGWLVPRAQVGVTVGWAMAARNERFYLFGMRPLQFMFRDPSLQALQSPTRPQARDAPHVAIGPSHVRRASALSFPRSMRGHSAHF